MYNKLNIHSELVGIRFLHHEISQFRWYSILLPFLACISQVSLSFLIIYLPKVVLDAVQSNQSFSYLTSHIVTIGMGVAAITLVNMFLHNEIAKVSQMFLFQRLTFLWERKTMNVSYHTFVSSQGKDTMEKARNVISSPNWGVVKLLEKEATVLKALIGLIAYSMIVSKLHIVMLIVLVLLFLVELVLGLQIEHKKQAYKEVRAKVDRRLNYLAYWTKGMQEAKDIRVYKMQSMLRKITETVIEDKSKVEADVQRWQFRHYLITATTILVRDSIAYVVLIWLYFYTHMTIGDFSLYFAAITGIGMWLNRLSDAISGFKEVSIYVQDFYEFIKLPEDDEGMDTANLEIPIAFTFRNVSFSYQVESESGTQTIPVITKLDLQVKPGEKIAIVGMNGAGKSTLIKMLCGMLQPESGEILVNGIDSTLFQKVEYYKLFSAVFQKSQILPISIADNIMLNVKKSKDEGRMWEVLRLVGLEEKVKSLPQKEHTYLVKRISEHGVDLSGGHKQRLLLARALYKDAPVLILDEPTAALDPISENEIYQKYSSLTKEKTSFFVSHRLASTRFCDRILFMEQGKIVESGTHEELMSLNGKYADMFRVQSRYYQNDTKEAM